MRRRELAAACATLACAVVWIDVRAQTAFTAAELAEYRLTEPVFKRFAHATRLIGAAIKDDPRFAADPLFTRDIALAGEAAEMAERLAKRLEGEPRLVDALFAADLTARDYTRFVLALIAARMAHGFITTGVLRAVPPGAASHNLAFVAAREPEVTALLTALGLNTH